MACHITITFVERCFPLVDWVGIWVHSVLWPWKDDQ